MKRIILLQLAIIIGLVVNAQIYQFRGPNRDGKFHEKNLLQEWPESGPELLLEYSGIGKGFSSVISNGEFIYATGKIDTLDYLTCLDFNGNQVWQTAYGESWKKSFSDTRSTPTLEDDRIYVVSGIGELVCLNAITGAINWKVNVDRDYQAEWHIWGVSESPLIVDDKVICTPGGNKTSVVAFNKITGEEIWQTPCVGGQRSYASPTLYTYNETRYILAITATHLIAINPETGEPKLTYQYFNEDKWDNQPGLIWTNIPLIKGDEIFLSMGYDYPAKMLKINADQTDFIELYTDTIFDNHHHGVIELDGCIYGSNWENNRKGDWICMDWKTGKFNYNESWNTKGEIIYADGLLFIYEEQKGNVAIVKPDPSGFDVISSFQITKGSGPHWSHPFIQGGKLFLRHGDVLFVYNLKA